MANRAKSSIIHLRVTPEHKRYIVALSNLDNTTETAIISGMVERAATERCVDGCMGLIPLTTAVGYAEQGEVPAIKMLRMFYLAPAALSHKERLMAQAIMENKFYFAGNVEIFAEDECHWPRMGLIPKINTDAVASHLNVLNDYALFTISNPKMRMDYPTYRKATDADSEV